MEKNDHFFTPDNVDEQIEQQRMEELQATPDAQFLSEMQQVARQIRVEHEDSLQRVEERLNAYALTHARHLLVTVPIEERTVQERRDYLMENNRPKSRSSGFGRRLSLLVAVLILGVLVGSLLLIQNNLYHRPTTQTGTAKTATPTATAKPTSLPEGTIVNTRIAGTSVNGFGAIVWSPDSKRIASIDDVNGLLIWDALTGAHKVAVKMPGAQDEPYDLSWSPNGQQLAIATGPHILLVNSQTGAVIRMYTAPTASASVSKNSPYLSTMLPASGDPLGYLAVRWSPDGHFLAVTLDVTPPTFTVQVLDAQTGSLAFSLPGAEGLGFGGLTWSFDSQYLAAVGGPTASQVWVWNVSTHQVVVRHTVPAGANDNAPAWQPGSHNLAFVEDFPKSGGGFQTELKIWNPLTNKEIYHLSTLGFASGSLSWSPNGQRLAYAAQDLVANQNEVVILNAASGQTVYVYKGQHHLVNLVAWSPDGTYIVSSEGNTFVKQGSLEAQIWIA